jgi:hypothetical protein
MQLFAHASQSEIALRPDSLVMMKAKAQQIRGLLGAAVPGALKS